MSMTIIMLIFRYRSVRYLLAVAAVLVVVGIITVLNRPHATEPAPFFNDDVVIDTTQVKEVIEEDNPAWDCRVHGNGICGPTQAPIGER